jgi:hypothetical protein
MIDLQKAFDTVDHNILCGKLHLMGIKNTNWFRSYLSNRKQVVHIGEVSSSPSSILGPLLFLCYVNDKITICSIDSECKLILYADDCTILFLIMILILFHIN